VADRLNRRYQLAASTGQSVRFVAFGSFVTVKAANAGLWKAFRGEHD
jgi:hypothetical protein